MIEVILAVIIFTGLIYVSINYWPSAHDRAMRNAVTLLKVREIKLREKVQRKK